MIPNDTWSDDQNITKYAECGLERPYYVSFNPYELELGPESIEPGGSVDLKNQWWVFEERDGDVFTDPYVDKNTPPQTYLFTSGEVKTLAATFDQLKRPLVFFDTGSELRLWWYDPTLEEHTLTPFGEGSDPFATFDIRYSPSNQKSDALIFYLRNGGIYYRQQRDRYAVEYATPVTTGAYRILRADMTVDWRLQILYKEQP